MNTQNLALTNPTLSKVQLAISPAFRIFCQPLVVAKALPKQEGKSQAFQRLVHDKKIGFQADNAPKKSQKLLEDAVAGEIVLFLLTAESETTWEGQALGYIDLTDNIL